MAKKFIDSIEAQRDYGLKPRTFTRWCQMDRLCNKRGEPEKGRFHGRARQVGRLWRVPVTEMERLFGE